MVALEKEGLDLFPGERPGGVAPQLLRRVKLVTRISRVPPHLLQARQPALSIAIPLSTLASLLAEAVPLDGPTGAAAAECLAAQYFARHAAGDWGDLSPADRRANREALKHGDRLLSSYNLPGGGRVWIITEWNRSATTLLLPEDY